MVSLKGQNERNSPDATGWETRQASLLPYPQVLRHIHIHALVQSERPPDQAQLRAHALRVAAADDQLAPAER